MKRTTTPPCRYRPRAGGEDDVLLQSMDESGRGPRNAVAEAVASPLGVQPTINSAGISSSTGQPLGIAKSYALRPVLRPCLAVGPRRCHSPKAGDGELQKAARESSFIRPSGSRCPRHVNDCKTSQRSRPRSPVCVCIRGCRASTADIQNWIFALSQPESRSLRVKNNFLKRSLI